jgi:hypothetical protein
VAELKHKINLKAMQLKDKIMIKEMRKYLDTFKNFNLNENNSVETKYRIVSDYGHGDKSWIDRDLTKEEVKDYFVKYRNWTEQDFDEVGIEHFMDTDFTHYVEIDNIDDVEGVD